MEVLRPRTLEEALAARAEHPEARPIQGGTDVMVELTFGHSRPDALLDLSEHAGLAAPTTAPGQVVAAVVFTDLSSFTPLAEAMGDEKAAEVLSRFAVTLDSRNRRLRLEEKR